MFRFAFAYQGGGGTGVTYLAGGATIDVRAASRSIDIKKSIPMDVQTDDPSLIITSNGKAIDITYDRNSIDL